MKKIFIFSLLLLTVLAVGTAAASQDFSQNDTAVSDDVLEQNDVEDIQQSELVESNEVIQSVQSQDEEVLQAPVSQDSLGAKVVENPEEQEVMTKVPDYLAESNIWFQEFDLNEEDSNMWIINDNGKAFPKESFIKIVVKEKGSKYKAQHTMQIEELFPERGMDNIHYYILLREFTDIQFKPNKSYNMKVYFMSATGKSHLIAKKNVKIKWSNRGWGYKVNGVYFFYRYHKNNPYSDAFRKGFFHTHPNDKQKIKVIIYKNNGKFYANKKVKYAINGGELICAKTNSRGLLIIDTPKKPGTYNFDVYAGKGGIDFKVKVHHGVSIPKVTLKKSAKKTVIPLQLRKINGRFYKNQKIVFKLDNKTYNVKTNIKGVAKVVIKKSALNGFKVGQKVKLQAIYKNDATTRIVKIQK